MPVVGQPDKEYCSQLYNIKVADYAMPGGTTSTLAVSTGFIPSAVDCVTPVASFVVADPATQTVLAKIPLQGAAGSLVFGRALALGQIQNGQAFTLGQTQILAGALNIPPPPGGRTTGGGPGPPVGVVVLKKTAHPPPHFIIFFIETVDHHGLDWKQTHPVG